jgi:hypothetical protein
MKMRNAMLTGLFVGLALSGAFAQQPPRIVSPEVLPDGRVTFRLNAPKAGGRIQRRYRECGESSEHLRQARRPCTSQQQAEAALDRVRHRGLSVCRGEEFFRMADGTQHHAHVPRNERRTHVDGMAPIFERGCAGVISVAPPVLF